MVKGLNNLHRTLGAVPEHVRNEVAAQMEIEAEKLVRSMRALAPKDTGELARSIGWTWGDAPKGSIVVAKSSGGHEYGKTAITIYAGGGGAYHARFQELGTENMPANPFFFPVYRSNRQRIRGAITRAVTRAVKKANKP